MSPCAIWARLTSPAVKALVASLTEADWTANTFRQDALAASVHSATDNILMKTEWHPSATSTGIRHLEDLVHVWAKERGLDPKKYLPIAREDTDVWPVYTMPDWIRYRDVIQPIVDQVVGYLKQPGGVITRLALVRLRGGATIAPHVDEHAMAAKAHRIHVSLTDTPSVVYKIGGKKYLDARRQGLRLQQPPAPFGAQHRPPAPRQHLHRLLCQSGPVHPQPA